MINAAILKKQEARSFPFCHQTSSRRKTPSDDECEEVSWDGHETNDWGGGGSTLGNLQHLKDFINHWDFYWEL